MAHIGVLTDGCLRIHDNPIIRALVASRARVKYLVYVSNPDMSENASYIGFLMKSLEDLDPRHVCILSGYDKLSEFIKEHNVDTAHISIVDAHTPKIVGSTVRYNDRFIWDPREILTSAGTPYRIFGAFAKRVMKMDIPNPAKGPTNLTGISLATQLTSPPHTYKITPNPNRKVLGGRREGLRLLRTAEKNKDYEKTRDFPRYDTTLLSAHHRFGTLSIRESYGRLVRAHGRTSTLPNQLVWREFYMHLMYHFPETRRIEMRKDRRGSKLRDWWKTDRSEEFKAWTRGETGVPIVDAGMIQLRRTGWMHNRVRMIASQYLTKNLHVDWRCGESWFARHLVDYDPSLNVGNWQWNAGVGTDPEPYGGPRMFNPIRQAKRYDPEGVYIRTWIPEALAERVPRKKVPSEEDIQRSGRVFMDVIKKLG